MEYTPTSEGYMDECCDICGDLGVIDAIVTCTRCKISREHLYCMRTCRFDHPESWCCEQCEDLIKASSLNNPHKLQYDSARPNKLPNDLRRKPMDCEKKIQTGKVKPLSAEEVIMLASGAKISGSTVKASVHSCTILQKRGSILERTPIMSGGVPPKSNSHLVIRNPSLELGKQLRPRIAWQQVAKSFGGLREKDYIQTPPLKQIWEEYIQKGQPMHTLEDNAATKSTQITVGRPAKTASLRRADRPILNSEKDATQAPLKKHTQSPEGQPMNAIFDSAGTKGAQITVEKATIASTTTSSLRIDQPINSGAFVSSNMNIPVAASGSVSPLSAPPKVGKCLYIPASDASWKGSFNVLLDGPKQGEIGGAIQAYPPSRVRKKVYEFSMLMPEVLKFELVQRGSLQMSLFGNYSPDSRDIGLYFFPSSCERCKNYMLLLEHIGEQDLVLRNYMDGLELFIFTSKILHMDCQRWNGMYFLWGLFRRMKLTITAIQAEVNHCHDEGDNNKAVDMEIDMIGGQNVGRLDVAVPRIPLQLPLPNHVNETFSDIPPGFEKMYRPTGETSCASAAKSEELV